MAIKRYKRFFSTIHLNEMIKLNVQRVSILFSIFLWFGCFFFHFKQRNVARMFKKTNSIESEKKKFQKQL